MPKKKKALSRETLLEHLEKAGSMIEPTTLGHALIRLLAEGQEPTRATLVKTLRAMQAEAGGSPVNSVLNLACEEALCRLGDKVALKKKQRRAPKLSEDELASL